MTDEEMAEAYVKETCDDSLSSFRGQELKETFLAGLKAGRPKWHKVSDGDLPKGKDAVLIYWKSANWRCFTVAEPYKVTEDTYIIAWCEIPKYMEE